MVSKMAVEIRCNGDTVTVQSAVQTVVAMAAENVVDVASAVIVGGIPYSGSYSVTPGETAQMLPTASRMLSQNVTVAPIPSNYGLITWDGARITVS